jgi:hypothetical protein
MDHEGYQPEAGPRIPGIEFIKAALRDLRNIAIFRHATGTPSSHVLRHLLSIQARRSTRG